MSIIFYLSEIYIESNRVCKLKPENKNPQGTQAQALDNLVDFSFSNLLFEKLF